MQNSIISYEMDGMDVVITKKWLLESNVIAGKTLSNMYMNVSFSWRQLICSKDFQYKI